MCRGIVNTCAVCLMGVCVVQVSRGAFIDNLARLLNAVSSVCANSLSRLASVPAAVASLTSEQAVGYSVLGPASGDQSFGTPAVMPMDGPSSPAVIAQLLLQTRSPLLTAATADEPPVPVAPLEHGSSSKGVLGSGGDVDDAAPDFDGVSSGSECVGFQQSRSGSSSSSVCDFSSRDDVVEEEDNVSADGDENAGTAFGADGVTHRVGGTDGGSALMPSAGVSQDDDIAPPPVPPTRLWPADGSGDGDAQLPSTSCLAAAPEPKPEPEPEPESAITALTPEDLVCLAASAVLFEDVELAGFAPFTPVSAARQHATQAVLDRFATGAGSAPVSVAQVLLGLGTGRELGGAGVSAVDSRVMADQVLAHAAVHALEVRALRLHSFGMQVALPAQADADAVAEATESLFYHGQVGLFSMSQTSFPSPNNCSGLFRGGVVVGSGSGSGGRLAACLLCRKVSPLGDDEGVLEECSFCGACVTNGISMGDLDDAEAEGPHCGDGGEDPLRAPPSSSIDTGRGVVGDKPVAMGKCLHGWR